MRISCSLLLATFAIATAGVGAGAGFSSGYHAEPSLVEQAWQHPGQVPLFGRQRTDVIGRSSLPMSLGTQASWSDLTTANSRRLALGRRIVERVADDVGWLQEQEAAAGVSESALQPFRDQLVRERELTPAIWNLTGLDEVQLELGEVARASALLRVSELRGVLDEAARLGVASGELETAKAAGEAAELAVNQARTTQALWRAIEGLSGPLADATKLKLDRAAELAAQAAAEQRARDYYNSLEGLRQRGYDALRGARNEAAWLAFLGRGSPGDGYLQMEAGAAALETADRPALSAAVDAEQRLATAVHQQFLARLPHKVILVSLAQERMWAYEDGGLVVDTLVTTGRPELPTDVGLMRIYRKNLNWLMHSPWGPGSPYWYPDLTVRYAMWFHPSGEAIHDSWWRSWYGPGSNLGGYGSHGCIGLPYGPIDTLYAWAPVNTPVVVIPGDGSSPGYQLARRTYNDPMMLAQFGA